MAENPLAVLAEAVRLSCLVGHAPNLCGTPRCAAACLALAQVDDVVARLRGVHARIDDLNAELASENQYCFLCRIRSYNAEVGVEHLADCPVPMIRAALKPFQEKHVS